MPFAFRKTHTSSIIWKFQHCAAMTFGQNFLLMENENFRRPEQKSRPTGGLEDGCPTVTFNVYLVYAQMHIDERCACFFSRAGVLRCLQAS